MFKCLYVRKMPNKCSQMQYMVCSDHIGLFPVICSLLTPTVTSIILTDSHSLTRLKHIIPKTCFLLLSAECVI